MGARKGISGGKCSPWCAIKEKLDSLWDKTHNAFTHVNGYEADGSQNLKINGSEGITVETVSGNEIRLIGVAAEPYTAESPIVIDPETRTVSLSMDSAPAAGSGNPVTSGGIYAADQALRGEIADVESDLSAETAARTAADTAESSARIAADNALGNRIDEVIDGTTPPMTISGVLPIQNGGTGSSIKNFVDLNTVQTINASKQFADGANLDFVFPIANAASITIWQQHDVHFYSTQGIEIFILRVYQQNNTRGLQIGIVDQIGDTHWTSLASYTW